MAGARKITLLGLAWAVAAVYLYAGGIKRPDGDTQKTTFDECCNDQVIDLQSGDECCGNDQPAYAADNMVCCTDLDTGKNAPHDADSCCENTDSFYPNGFCCNGNPYSLDDYQGCCHDNEPYRSVDTCCPDGDVMSPENQAAAYQDCLDIQMGGSAQYMNYQQVKDTMAWDSTIGGYDMALSHKINADMLTDSDLPMKYDDARAYCDNADLCRWKD